MSSSYNADYMLASNQSAVSMDQAKRSRSDETPSKKEKAPKLPPECRIPVFKFLPTSELVKFISKTRPLLGEYWGHELKFVVEQRLPFGVFLNSESIPDDPFKEPVNLEFAVSDCLENKIADVKHPELFKFSPLCELTEYVHLPATNHHSDSPLVALFGKELLAPLTNLRSLKLEVCDFRNLRGCTGLPLYFSSLSPEIQQVLSQVESLHLARKPLYGFSLSTFLLHRLESLKKLEFGIFEFCAAMPVMVPFKRLFEFSPLPHHATAEMLMRLESLCIFDEDGYGAIVPCAMRQILHFLGTNCVQLSGLSLPLHGEISHYMPAFRAMPNLVKLALDVRSLESNGLIDCEGPCTTINELSVAGQYHIPNHQVILLAVLAKLPYVRTLSINAHYTSDTLRLAADVLSRQLFPSLDSLKCIPSVAASFYLLKKDLQPLLEHSNLPLRVQILPSKSFAFVTTDPDCLVALYGIMKTNSAQFLLMKGPLHAQALARLEEVIAEDRKNRKMARVLAWTDKDLPVQRTVIGLPTMVLPDFTDVKISGVKDAGPKNGEEFTIRICHQHTRVTSYIILREHVF